MSSHEESSVAASKKAPPQQQQQQQQQNSNKKEPISSKIIQRLNHLTPSTSKESIQAFTKWLLFHVTVTSGDDTDDATATGTKSTADGSSASTSTDSTMMNTTKSKNINNNRIIYRTLKKVLTLDPKLLQFNGGGGSGDKNGSGVSNHNSHNQSNEQNSENIRTVMKWSKMLNIYWYIIHELCVCYHGSVCNNKNNNKAVGSDDDDTENRKWMKYTNFRSMLAENVILPLLQDLLELLELCSKSSIGGGGNGGSGDNNDSNTITSVPVGPPLIVITAIINTIKELPLIKDHQTKKLDTFLSKWEDIDSFQSPTLLDDIKRVIVKIVQFDHEKAKEEQLEQQRHTKKLGEVAAPGRGKEERKIKGGGNDDDKNLANTSSSSGSSSKVTEVKDDDGKAAGAATTATDTTDSTCPDKKDDSSSASITTPSTPNSNIIDHQHDTTAADTTPTVTSDGDDVIMAEDGGSGYGIDEDLFGGGDDDDDSVNNNNNNNDNDMEDTTKKMPLDTKNETNQSSKIEDIDNKNKATENSSSISSTKPKEGDTLTVDSSTKSKKRGFVDLDAEIDFDKEGIPKGRVEVHDLEVPCQTIGKMQISRDLRNDFSHNLSSSLSLVPNKVYEECEKALENKDSSEATIASIVTDDKDSLQIPNEVLDYNLSDALSNIRLHRQIIEKQMEARQKCIELLLKSRCEFGSKADAETFFSLDDISESLAKRKAQILDAMELEGLDFEGLDEGGNDQKDDINDDQPTAFAWYTKEEAKINRDIKKQRVE
eukprot:CAMPEP_0203671636 /NCGR_PEP_ID=MMETSP0090-20130426/7360_1 /ASSEMBLY_ACC=CAM_ASM_001088 /TAXON_ID=426623 /ORGANISM="Chaetoceros affinis, Strain CCMP159" /LENGTH=767 /DNA_ID=CAMNT_0050536747 /DNA_START=124 /DNA_END=2427 /DNA_ORIENTATION=-